MNTNQKSLMKVKVNEMELTRTQRSWLEPKEVDWNTKKLASPTKLTSTQRTWLETIKMTRTQINWLEPNELPLILALRISTLPLWYRSILSIWSVLGSLKAVIWFYSGKAYMAPICIYNKPFVSCKEDLVYLVHLYMYELHAPQVN